MTPTIKPITPMTRMTIHAPFDRWLDALPPVTVAFDMLKRATPNTLLQQKKVKIENADFKYPLEILRLLSSSQKPLDTSNSDFGNDE